MIPWGDWGIAKSVKARDFDSRIRWFESSYPSQIWFTSSVGRAPDFYSGCPGFESRVSHHFLRFHLIGFGALVKRLRHRPFTAASWVRIPYASPFYHDSLAQLAEQLTLNQ